MNHEQNHTRLRELLDRWYAGSSSREEEWEISFILSASPNLPSDLEIDSRLFLAFSENVAEDVPMPAEYSARIDAALVAEMGLLESNQESPGSSRSYRRRWLYWSVAACIAMLVCGLGLSWLTRNTVTEQTPISQPRVALVTMPLLLPTSADASVPTSFPSSESAPKIRYKKASTTPNLHVHTVPENSISHHPAEEIELLPEEKALAASNYRVVYDSREAEEIVASVLSRLERNMGLELMRLAKIEIEHESEMARLSSIDNVGVLRECYDSHMQPRTSQPSTPKPTSSDNTNAI